MLQVPLRIIGQDPVVALPPPKAPPEIVWLASGFRPFFLAASAGAVLLMGVWLAILAGLGEARPGLSPIQWHAHEMLFGFGGAVVAGFLLTAVPNWTQRPTPKGLPLAALTGLWVLGRLGSWWGGLAGAALDLLFLPLLGWALAGPLWKAGQARNLVFLPVLGALWVADLVFWNGYPSTSLMLALYGLLMLIAIVGGRVIPFFTERALANQPARHPVLEALALAGLPLCAWVECVSGIPPHWKLAILGATAAFHLTRLLHWGSPRLLQVPLLWVLYLAYLYLPLGLVLRGLAWFGVGSLSAATHALTVGCVALMCLGMMGRVALGHTGRELKPARATVVAFALLGLAGVCRSLIPFCAPQLYQHAVWCSGLLWCVAFALFAVVYFPVLTRPRVDGKPG